MKRALGICCVCWALFGGAGICTSQTLSLAEGIREISVAAGTVLPYLPVDLRKNWKNGWNAGLAYGKSLPQGKLGTSTLALEGSFSRFALDQAGILAQFPGATDAVKSGATTTLSLMAQYRGTFTSVSRLVQPFFTIGLGYLHVAQGAIALTGALRRDTTIAGGTKDGVAWSAGVGFSVPLNETVQLFAQAQSVLGVMTPARQFFPLTAGFRYRY